MLVGGRLLLGLLSKGRGWCSYKLGVNGDRD
jgi:hypothetical protein